MRHVARPAAALFVGLALLLARCDSLTAVIPTPTTFGPVVDPTLGPIDRALEAIDFEAVLRQVDPTHACRPGSLTGSTGDYHTIRDFTCPRTGDDRTVAFAFTDAVRAAIEGTGASISESGSASGGATEPAFTDWVVRGNGLDGTGRVLMVDGPGTVTMYASLDLTGP